MEVSDLVAAVANAAKAAGCAYYVTGSVASSVWGEPRSTLDLDVVVDLSPERVETFCAEFGEAFYVDRESAMEAVNRGSMFCIIAPEWGLKIDVIVPKDRTRERERMARALDVSMAQAGSVRFSSPEDCILSKMEFFVEGGSQKHLRDIAGILANTNLKIDLQYITSSAAIQGLGWVWEDVRNGRRPKHASDGY